MHPSPALSFPRRSGVFILALALCAIAPLARADINPLVATFKQWGLVCDNVRRCEARSLTHRADATVSVIRNGGPAQPVIVRLARQGPLPLEDLTVDGMPSALSQLSWAAQAAPSGVTAWTVDGEAAVQAVTLLRNAETLRLGDSDLALAGMTASLLAMEDHQGRLDTTTAIIRQGPLDDNRAWPASPLPVVARAVAFDTTPPTPAMMAQAREHRAADQHWECPRAPDAPRDLGFGFTKDEALVFLECERLAHSSRYVPLRVRHDASAPPERLILTMVANAQYLQMEGVPRPTLDAEHGRLTMAEGAGGYSPLSDGDCGLRATWQYDGVAFELIEYAEQAVCGGVPQDWPIWYRARVRP
ncbi:DUF1176 domain-containing protein [Achromobacter sp. GG226]|uniref:DUF1176 domain-containing protein n=1 Tax=Verticiella alkaliphila TaxID=2779529 RepID=UPI001C0D8EA5|nr:DUF1176 domain-containing protein [Verticiella sp. GG226]MBU4610782.1 DUF1176 domain-containing protein [Verticiella sp. GG226]